MKIVKKPFIQDYNLIISVDGNSQESYVEYRKNGDFEKVKKELKT